ncbi:MULTISPECIES: hypothetical protein [Marinobacter]|jgi:hypothetical protein|uniref:Uncharacterized protein n=1 Tax=Marinobacter salsuginis TaxID=418719 RepID=A0A5M3Q1N9_9GAMM|nr:MULTISPECIES: hypothetical protein [Marinobacter]GBO89016.1 hypothetical protein MSSD14B_26840 [Marinobacter salsuginis]|tara:strand:- start:744 stop:1160 length:417 start_codon:yes stop_codon:yes gene_type:complete
MAIEFVKLNKGWNAEPNSPDEKISIEDADLTLEFTVNPWAHDGFEENERVRLVFRSCSQYRLGPTNDEGWYAGQCRFGQLAPDWGEFYSLRGEADEVLEATDWVPIEKGTGGNHYLFYLRDCTFECKADTYELQRINS